MKQIPKGCFPGLATIMSFYIVSTTGLPGVATYTCPAVRVHHKIHGDPGKRRGCIPVSHGYFPVQLKQIHLYSLWPRPKKGVIKSAAYAATMFIESSQAFTNSQPISGFQEYGEEDLTVAAGGQSAQAARGM